MNIYDIFITYIMPYFVDLSKFEYAEQAFYYLFCAVSAFIVISVFILFPYRMIKRMIFGKKRGQK